MKHSIIQIVITDHKTNAYYSGPTEYEFTESPAIKYISIMNQCTKFHTGEHFYINSN